MLGQFRRVLGDENQKMLKGLRQRVPEINGYEPDISALSDESLAAKTDEFKRRLAEGEALDALLPEAFAVVRETAKRVLGERHFDVQLMGGVALHEGRIAEMRTGEGKTLVATLPAYLNALGGESVHIVTVNDYLSRRDAAWMGQIYAFLGLSVSAINGQNQSFLYDETHTNEEDDATRDLSAQAGETGAFKVEYEFLRPCSRQEAYQADIVYGTNNEFGFDYLRDNIEYKAENLRQRELAFAIVDEIDSILIDEARTPLIIAAPAEESENLYVTFASIATQLKKDTHYTVDEKMRAVQMTDAGIEKAEELLGVENLYTERGIKYVHHLETAVRAKALFERDKHYVVRDGEVVIVDEFTGRLQPGRRWSEGLHQAIEAKEGVPLQQESRTFASITFQNFFRLYDKLAGMTGTAMTSQEEFFKVYGLPVVAIPTNKPIERIDHDDLIFQTEQGKFKAIARKIREVNEKGQPVLIGTVSIEKNEVLSAYLKKEGVAHEMLNAKNHEREGEIIAQAGQKGRVTLATNMAGRGVDIKLGGNPATKESYEAVKSIGGLFVLGTERHEARRIDNQLRGRAGRQGDPGETQFFVSLEDTLMRVFAPDMVRNMMGRFGIPEDEPIENRMITRSLERAQTKIEGFNFDARKNVLSFDDVLAAQRASIYERRGRILKGDAEEVKAELSALIAGDAELERTVREKEETLGRDAFLEAVRRLMLQTIDTFWIEHLEAMDYMRSSVNLRAYGQRDPLIEYKKEGLRMFHEMQEAIDEQILRLMPAIEQGAFTRAQEGEREKLQEIHRQARIVGDTSQGGSSSAQPARGSTPAEAGEKIGRNEIVTVTNGKETHQMKFKKAEPLLKTGAWTLVKK